MTASGYRVSFWGDENVLEFYGYDLICGYLFLIKKEIKI